MPLVTHIFVADTDFTSGTTIMIPPPGTRVCTDFTNLVVNDNLGLEGDESFTILIGGAMAMVTITENDRELINLIPCLNKE